MVVPPSSLSGPLPPDLRVQKTISFDTSLYDFHAAVVSIIHQAASLGAVIGDFEVSPHKRLENFKLDPSSLRTRGKEIQCIFFDLVSTDPVMRSCYERLLQEVVIPNLMEQLVALGSEAILNARDVSRDDGGTVFYCQGTPTLRLQPGPTARCGQPHDDAQFGHQEGEVNFWMPLTSYSVTKTALWVESVPGRGDYKPIDVPVGQMAAFHGTFCRHYAESNPSEFTRASLDFRVGVGSFFDPTWEFRAGARADTGRIKIVYTPCVDRIQECRPSGDLGNGACAQAEPSVIGGGRSHAHHVFRI